MKKSASKKTAATKPTTKKSAAKVLSSKRGASRTAEPSPSSKPLGPRDLSRPMTYKDPSELSEFGRWCLDHKLSQRDIAGLIGRSRQMVNRYWVDDGEVPQIVQIMFYEMWDLLPEKTRRTLLERFPAQ